MTGRAFLFVILYLSMIAIADAEFLDLGPVRLYLDMAAVPDPFLELKAPYGEVHQDPYSPDQDVFCVVYAAHIGHRPDAVVQIHEMQEPWNSSLDGLEGIIRSSGLLPDGWTYDSGDLNLTRHRGAIVNATSSDQEKVRVGALALDQEGGKAKRFCLVASRCRKNCTLMLMESLRFMPSPAI
ncbi:MAG TPA: hypothetical protein PLI05_05625 [Methanotrichaceae archaeon]|nr:MAG: hypothetical protein A4E47_01508 [Methanosaeta sp. PtaU1.Bin028]HOT06589.1 hypothetical protein [Methanotrichaceae archaeon]HQF16529.1 hypothetical protein [Methanotrichaceae archaeon]HQI91100.1 hypothetical protein [Methanotrichaceae archaeon]HQJ28509.1 hypothetical protein [Methanotrichaceae archaeon]